MTVGRVSKPVCIVVFTRNEYEKCIFFQNLLDGKMISC